MSARSFRRICLAASWLALSVMAASCGDAETTTVEDPPTCADPPCEEECADPPCEEECADPPCEEECAEPPCEEECADPPCDPVVFAFEHVPIEIVDPVVNGSSLMTPIDGISYALDGAGDLVTSFGRSLDTPTDTFLWHLALADGSHAKIPLTGTPFPPSAAFCAGEQWCQLIGFDGGDIVVVGPAANDMMRVSSGNAASLVGVSGTQPAASLINHAHRFAAGELFLFGATGPASFDDTVHVLTLSTGVWRTAATGLPETDNNCIAYDDVTDTLFSVAGRVTTDGGNTSTTMSTLTSIDIAAGTFETSELPAEIGARRGMSCAFDSSRGLLFALGGARVEDNFNDALNTFFNDLWAYEVATDTWTRIVEGDAGGTLGDPDQYGDQRFIGDPAGPNFGRNRGHMLFDAAGDRLLVIGSVPVFTHEQLYRLSLEGIDQLLAP